MDIQKCHACGKEFDFDTSGLEGPNGVIVCGSDCAKQSAAKRGNKFAIHDKTGAITETDIKPTDGPLNHRW